jgi:hypothetical protein
MAKSNKYLVGSIPPQIVWTIVRGDTAAFRVYVTDDAKQPLVILDWDIEMKIKRPNSRPGVITDDATLIYTLTPTQDLDDEDGEFTVSLTAVQTDNLETGDIFDIELSKDSDATVWTVAQGTMNILEDVTD